MTKTTPQHAHGGRRAGAGRTPTLGRAIDGRLIDGAVRLALVRRLSRELSLHVEAARDAIADVVRMVESAEAADGPTERNLGARRFRLVEPTRAQNDRRAARRLARIAARRAVGGNTPTAA